MTPDDVRQQADAMYDARPHPTIGDRLSPEVLAALKQIIDTDRA